MKEVFLRRKFDDALLSIPERDLESTLKTGKFELVPDANKVYDNSLIQFPTYENALECPFCGIVFESKQDLMWHKSNHE